jgi:hypothetical protein
MMVVLNRTAMGVAEVPELRRVVKRWADAQRHQLAVDALTWRRRLGQDSHYLLMDPNDRREVLHRLMCAAWNGQFGVVTGSDDSPTLVDVHVGAPGATPLGLELVSLGELSSWATLLQGYELWILADDIANRRDLSSVLMDTLPTDVRRNVVPPSALYRHIVDMADGQRELIMQTKQNRVLSKDPQLELFEEFWTVLLPAALRQPVRGTTKSLLDLREQVEQLAGGRDA